MGYIAIHQVSRLIYKGVLRKHAMANSYIRISCYSWSSKGQRVQQFDKKKSTAHHTSFNHPRLTKSPIQAWARNVCQMARKSGHTLHNEDYRANYRYLDEFLNTVFNHFPLEIIFLKPRGINYFVSQSPFPSKIQNRQKAQTSFLNNDIIEMTSLLSLLYM